MINAKNRVLEKLDALGLPRSLAVWVHTGGAPGEGWTSTLTLTLPDRAPIVGVGTAGRKPQADVVATEAVLAALASDSDPDGHDWAKVYAEAQAGDALVKLAAYLTGESASPEDRSRWLQQHESDAALARVFDRWLEEGAPELVSFGRGLGEKNKATVVEAVIWRRYHARVLGSGAGEALGELRAALSGQ